MSGEIVTAGYRWSILFLAFFCLSGWAADRSVAVSEGLLGNTNYGLFVEALQKTVFWQQIVDAESVTVFVPSDTSLENEGSAFLLKVVLQKKENLERLHDLVAQHVYHLQDISLETMSTPRTFSNILGGCTTVTPSGEKSVRVGPEAFVTGHENFANGDIYFIDRLLWQAYDSDISC